MATCFLAPDPIQSTNFIPGTNTPANGAKLFFYVAQSVNTKQTVFKDMNGAVAWSNPIVLDSGGNIPSGGEVWFPQGESFLVVYAPATDTDPPTSPYWSKDNLTGQNDVTGAQSEWVQGPTPTFISGTSFSLVGDQTGTFTIGRRTKTTNTGGTIYSTITGSTFGVVTTVNVLNDSGSLDAGLSAVFYGLISAKNTSLPGTHGTVCFTSSVIGLTTTWSSPVATAWVSGAGGGGGGGGRGVVGIGVGSGGSSADVIIKQQVSLTPLTVYSIVVGAGGAAGLTNTGGSGSTTVMSSVATGVVISIAGGAGGSTAAASSNPVAGGTAPGNGQNGGIGTPSWFTVVTSFAMMSGKGGDTPWGGGGFAVLGTHQGTAQNGAPGIFGSGGSGACSGDGVGGSGAPGGSGIFIIEW